MGDILAILSLLSLVLAVIYPSVKRAAFDRRLDGAIAAVDALRMAAEANLAETGAWPAEAPVEMVPAELAGRLPADFTFVTEFFTLDWELWETVREPEAAPGPEIAMPEAVPIRGRTNLDIQVPDISPLSTATVSTLAGITLRSADEPLLASLLERFGHRRSFVGPGTWTLILIAPAAP
jgi:hypothetical protein